MCKILRDVILFPLNVFGKKKQSFKYDLASIPVYRGSKHVDIEFEGERMEISYTITGMSGQEKGKIFPNKDVKYNSFSDGFRFPYNTRAVCSEFYVLCTNAKSLTINGEKYI